MDDGKYIHRPRMRGRHKSNHSSNYNLMNESVEPELGDLIFDKQLPPLQLCNGQIVGGRMGKRVVDFLFKCLMTFLKFRKMRFDRHMACLLALNHPALSGMLH